MAVLTQSSLWQSWQRWGDWFVFYVGNLHNCIYLYIFLFYCPGHRQVKVPISSEKNQTMTRTQSKLIIQHNYMEPWGLGSWMCFPSFSFTSNKHLINRDVLALYSAHFSPILTESSGQSIFAVIGNFMKKKSCQGFIWGTLAPPSGWPDSPANCPVICDQILLHIFSSNLESSCWVLLSFVMQLDSFVSVCVLSWDPLKSWLIVFSTLHTINFTLASLCLLAFLWNLTNT